MQVGWGGRGSCSDSDHVHYRKTWRVGRCYLGRRAIIRSRRIWRRRDRRVRHNPEGSVKNGVSGNVTPFPVTPGFNTIQTATRYVAESIGGEGGLSQDAPTPGKPGSGISAGGGGGGGANKYTSGLSGAGGKGSDGFVLIEW